MRKLTIVFLLAILSMCISVNADETYKVTDGYYVISPLCATTKSITVAKGSTSNKANIYLYRNGSVSKQIFYIKTLSDGSVILKNKKSGLVIETAGTKNKSNIRQGKYKKKKRQQWDLIWTGNGYIFKNSACNKVLSVRKSGKKNGTNIYLYSYNGSNGQKFLLKKIETKTEKVIEKEDDYIHIVESQVGVDDSKQSSRKWKESDYAILTNIVGAVESGGQIYGNRDYAAYDGPGANTDNEVTITVGWAQYYGSEAQRLIKDIYNKDKHAFHLIDAKGQIEKMLQHNWVKEKWKPTNEEKATIIRLLTSDAGKKCQDELFKEYMRGYVADCMRLYTDNAYAVIMYCEIRHLGGINSVQRIFDRCEKDYSLDNILKCLAEDQLDHTSEYQVGDEVFRTRHEKCCEFIEKYL